jgi:hypothetical protein
MGEFYLDDVDSPICSWKEHVSHSPLEHALALPLPSRDLHEPFDINTFEITALLRAFKAWKLEPCCVIIESL